MASLSTDPGTTSPDDDPSSSHHTASHTGRILALVLASTMLVAACSGDTGDENATVADTAPTAGTADEPAVEPESTDEEAAVEPVPNEPAAEPGEERVGYELLERMNDGTLRAWVSDEPMTPEEFGAIELPANWLKNQPRESSIDSGTFNGSPGADGVTVYEEHFGHRWFHSATVVQVGVPVDDEGLLSGAIVEKDHEIGFDPGSTVVALVSPEGDTYVRIGRDAGRTSDDPSLPTGWKIIEIEVTDGYTSLLPNGTLVIRTDNQDSFQGPVTGLDIEPGTTIENASAPDATTGVGTEAGDANTDELTAFLAAAPDEDGVFYMVNLIRFRDAAEYPAAGTPISPAARPTPSTASS